MGCDDIRCNKYRTGILNRGTVTDYRRVGWKDRRNAGWCGHYRTCYRSDQEVVNQAKLRVWCQVQARVPSSLLRERIHVAASQKGGVWPCLFGFVVLLKC
jgi:hypothetical protein